MTERKRRLTPEQKAALRRKHHRQVIRNRIIFGVACALILVLIIFIISKIVSALTSGKDTVDTSTLTINADGSAYFEEITDFDEDTYSSKELKSYIKDLISSYNETAGDEAITLDDYTVKGDKADVTTTYASLDDYSAFSSYPVYMGTIEEAYEAGYTFDTDFCEVSEGTKGYEIKTDIESDFTGCYVVIIEENVDVKVPGTVALVSKNSTELKGTDTVSISQEDGNNDATDQVYIIFSLNE